MNSYEVLIVFKPFFDADNPENAVKAIEKALKGLDAKMVKVEKLGRKRLAYEINKFKDGFMVSCLLELPAENVEKFRKILDLNEDVLRLTLLRLDEVSLAAITNPRVREELPGGREGGGRGFGGGRDFRDRGDRREGGGGRGRFDR